MACLATTVKIIGKKLNTFLRSLLRYCKDIANLFGYFGHTWPNPSKKIVSICRKLLMFINMQKIRFITHFFLKILQRFWRLWACLTMATKDNNFYNTLMLIFFQKKLYLTSFLKMLLRYRKHVILFTLSTPGQLFFLNQKIEAKVKIGK